MRRKIIILLAVIMAVTSLQGCAKKNTSEDGSNFTDGKSLKEARLVFYMPGDAHYRFYDVIDEIEKKAKNALNVELDFRYVPNNMIGEVETVINSNEPIEAFITHNLYMHKFISKGYLKDITRLFPKYAPAYYKQLGKELVKTATYDDRIYAVPSNALPETRRVCAVVRDDLLKKYNIKSIESFEEYENFLNLVKSNETSTIPALFYNTSIGLFAEAYGYEVMDNWLGMVYRRGDPDMKVIPWEAVPEYRKAIETLNRWKQNGYVVDNFTDQPLYSSADFSSGRYASFLLPPGSAEKFNVLKENESGRVFKYLEFDLYPGKPSSIETYLEKAFSFINNSPNVERSLMFIDWLQSDIEIYNLMMYGIKDEDYMAGKNGSFQPPADSSYEESYMGWVGKNPFLNMYNEYKDEKYVDAYMKKLKKYGEYPSHLGFHLDEWTMYNSEDPLGPKRQSYSIDRMIAEGGFRMDELDKYVLEKKEIADAVAAAFQTQLDAWKRK